ncbi:glycosyltransferase [Shewanella frigidimarina]|uniref:Glycosyl transferase, family 2 n=1 Tax=Shewanella frigidimarina (strain NCIMB 400) TaxID=318167 RepID=Q07Z86_SHEFN|nr:glycosyltransferase family 2 protein [Shewanella frigidimarina]ABI72678.1 glycosyl transferase, family 2 [Shewanella frigidimarina NCIMB 400]
MLASIVIRTLNEERYLKELLTAIRQQKCIIVDLEIVVIDSGSTDKTLSIAKEYGARITHINKSEFTFGRSLNMGCEFAKGDFFIFVSGHCIPASDEWLDELCRPFVDSRADYSYGRQIGRDSTKFSEQCHFNKWFPEYNKIPQQGYFCNNANAAVTRQAWLKYRFCEKLTGLEDMHFAKQLVDDGGAVAYVASAPVYHIHDETWRQVRTRYEREAYALKDIMPDVHFSLSDFIRYYISGVMSDSAEAIRQKTFLSNIKDIFLFRFNHYWGTYIGNHEVRKLSKQKKLNYFYPKDLEKERYHEKKNSSVATNEGQ